MERETLTRARVAELRELAAELGVPGRWRMKKAMLIEAILEARTAADADPAAADPDDVDTLVPLDDDEPDVDIASLGNARIAADDGADAPAEVGPGAPVRFDDEDTEVAPVLAAEDEPEPVEPDTVFIDRGPPLPEAYPGRRVRVMVRDPETLFAYWESQDAVEAWEVSAWRGDTRLHSFRTDGWVRNGYLRVPSGTVGRVTLAPVRAGRAAEAVASIAFRTPGTSPGAHGGEERWVEVDDATFEARRAWVVARAAAGGTPAGAPPSMSPAPAPGPLPGPAATDEGFTSHPPGFPYTRDDG